MHVGKWGLGYNGSTGAPPLQGWDEYYGELDQANAHNMYPPFLWSSATTGQEVMTVEPLVGNLAGDEALATDTATPFKQNSSGLCLGVNGGDTAIAGAELLVYDCMPKPSQTWSLDSSTAGTCRARTPVSLMAPMGTVLRAPVSPRPASH
jgi:hypothetical protein